MIYIESVEPGCVVLTDSPKSMEGHRACVDTETVAWVLAVLDGTETAKGCDGFEIRRVYNRREVFVSFDGEETVLDWREQELLKHALKSACLQLIRTRT